MRTFQKPPSFWLMAGYALLAMAMQRSRGGDPVRAPERPQARPATGAFGTARATDEPRHIQHARAAEPERGREADSPTEIPRKGWKDILWRTYEQISEDRLLAVAAGVVY